MTTTLRDATRRDDGHGDVMTHRVATRHKDVDGADDDDDDDATMTTTTTMTTRGDDDYAT